MKRKNKHIHESNDKCGIRMIMKNMSFLPFSIRFDLIFEKINGWVLHQLTNESLNHLKYFICQPLLTWSEEAK